MIDAEEKIDRQKIIAFLKSKDFCVLSTASPVGNPESAVMAYAVQDDFSFFIHTEPQTRKYKNIQKNNKVSLVIGGWNNDPSVQIDGLISELDQEWGQKARNYVLGLHPEWKDYFNSPDGKWFEIKALWLRYSDFSAPTPEIREMRIDWQR